MIRLPKSLVLAAAGAGLFTSIVGDASACDGKRGGYRPVYRPAYTQPCQQAYAYQQPLVQQPQFQQQQVPPQVQQWMPQGQQGQQVQIQGQQTIQGQQFQQQGQQLSQQGQQVVQQGQQVAQQGQQFQQGVSQQQVGSSAVVTQNTSVASPIGGASSAAANVSAIGALGGSASAATGMQSQNLAAPAQTNVAAPVNGSAVNGSAVANAPAASAPATGNAAPAISNTAPAASAEQAATESALQALMGDAAQASQPVTAAPQAAPVGEFSATLTNGTTIRLSLRADGSFNWVATKGDKVSSFQGTFNFNGSSLALNRSNDRQKLEGALALTAGGFKLQLSGQNAEGLNFVRA